MLEHSADYRTLLSNIADIVVLVDDGMVVYANAASVSLCERPEDEIVGQSLSHCFPPEFATAALAIAQEIGSGLPSVQRELGCVRPDGAQRAFSLRGSAVCLEHGRPTAMLVATDVTHDTSLRHELGKLNRSLRVLSEIDNALIHQRQEESLLRKTCAILVKTGRYRFAWAGDVAGAEAGAAVRPVASFGLSRKAVAQLASSRAGQNDLPTPAAAAVSRAQQVVVSDTRQETRFSLPRLAGKRYLSSVDIPLRVGSSLVGVLSIYDAQPNSFEPAEAALLGDLAANLSYGIESIRNRIALQQALKETNALSRKLIRSQEQTRLHLSREIHDQLGSLTTGILMSLNFCEQTCSHVPESGIAGVKELVQELIDGVRNMSQTLRPPMLDDFGLLPTVEWYIEKFSERTGIYIDSYDHGIDRRLDPDLEIAIFRLLQEALTNLAKHAETTTASVSITVTRGLVRLVVQDYGRGFDLASVSRTTVSNGLTGMRERAALLGGSLSIDTAPGKGTKLTAVIPTTQLNRGEQSWSKF